MTSQGERGGFELSFDPLSSEQQTKEVAIPVSRYDRKRGVFHVTLQDIPKGIYSSLLTSFYAANQANKKLNGITQEIAKNDKIESVTELEKILADSEAILATAQEREQAHTLRHVAYRNVIKWGVRDHRAEDFRYPKKKGEKPTGTPFESQVLKHQGTEYQCTGEKTLALYHALNILHRLVDVVFAFQTGTLQTPEEIWKEEEDKKKKVTRKPRAKRTRKK